MQTNVYDYYNKEIAQSCYFGEDLVKTLFGSKYQVYQKPSTTPLSMRRVEGLKKIAYLRNYYLRNPVHLIKDFFNIELLDYQVYMFMSAWNCPNVVLLCSRGAGKSTMSDLLIMAKQMLVQHWDYIASGSGSQSEQTFTTLERIANDRIDSMVGSTGHIFKDEVEIKNAAGDGFSHSSDGFTYTLYNGSFLKTLNSNSDRRRGIRCDTVLFDEVGFISDELIETYKAFVVVDKNFKTGSIDGISLDPIRIRSLPIDIPHQLIYVTSASSMDTPFYKIYKDASKRMLMGDRRYFVANINCDVLTSPTLRGKSVAPLLSKDTIETAMRTNPEKARREYYCEFTTDAGTDAIIRRGTITRNEVTRKPLLYNDTGDKKFVICYDPARSRDNSVILVGEVYNHNISEKQSEVRGRIVNCINLIDVNKKSKTPMQTPEQIEYLKQVILAYNEGGDDTYSNIIGVYIDAGSGGGGVNIADYLMPNWKDKKGIEHRGLIDKEYSSEYVKKFPDAVDKVHLMSPTMYKSEMYEAMIELVNQNKIEFTAQYDNKGYLTMFLVDEDKLKKEKEAILSKLKKQDLSPDILEQRLNEELSKVQNVKTSIEKLTKEEEIALTGIDAMKEEVINMVRIKRATGKDSFELTAEKRSKLHDDRSYCLSLFSYALMQERRKAIIQRKPTSSKGLVDKLPMRRAKRCSAY